MTRLRRTWLLLRRPQRPSARPRLRLKFARAPRLKLWCRWSLTVARTCWWLVTVVLTRWLVVCWAPCRRMLLVSRTVMSWLFTLWANKTVSLQNGELTI